LPLNSATFSLSSHRLSSLSRRRKVTSNCCKCLWSTFFLLRSLFSGRAFLSLPHLGGIHVWIPRRARSQVPRRGHYRHCHWNWNSKHGRRDRPPQAVSASTWRWHDLRYVTFWPVFLSRATVLHSWTIDTKVETNNERLERRYSCGDVAPPYSSTILESSSKSCMWKSGKLFLVSSNISWQSSIQKF
jgi:hypothetical protein